MNQRSENDRSHTFADLQGRRAVVTGSSTGIGRAIALELARAGAGVLVHAAHNADAARSTAEEVRGLGVWSEVIMADLADPVTRNRFIERAWKCWDGVDIWVNNAGADLLTTPAARADYEKKLRILLEVDVSASVLISKAVGQRMKSGGGGVIINIGWDQADRGMEGDSGELFAASKNAVMGFTRSLAVSLAPEVRVNCVSPGWIRTKWGENASEEWQNRVLRETPLNRWGTPEDIAKTTRFLVSDEANFLTGQVVNVNGGAVR
ncbi:SDR family NAD(P)-dependent oxidoreductase [Thalassoroseus pseudoceratinae]|uniref:SDR family NAD(P)-dependent oxidoreductase n=1 Tax=Thalassoroseus pseudoceratinae TaxID=2713176 RepID=UPI00141F5592|nr:SDR family oxidoreductase [Thalassoroseus pseudoceratinae]